MTWDLAANVVVSGLLTGMVYGLMALGLALFPGIWYLPIILVLTAFLYYERIAIREEAFLADAVLPDVLVERSRTQPRLVLEVVVFDDQNGRCVHLRMSLYLALAGSA